MLCVDREPIALGLPLFSLGALMTPRFPILTGGRVVAVALSPGLEILPQGSVLLSRYLWPGFTCGILDEMMTLLRMLSWPRLTMPLGTIFNFMAPVEDLGLY